MTEPLSKDHDVVLSVIRHFGGATIGQIVRTAAIPDAVVRLLVSQLAELGYVRSDRGELKVWSVTAGGINCLKNW